MKLALQILGMAALLALAGCGQKGPLVLPPPQPNATPARPAEAAPATPAANPLDRPGARNAPQPPGSSEQQ